MTIDQEMKNIINKFQVNVPFTMLVETYLETFLSLGLNPEIGIDAVALDKFTFEDFREILSGFHEAGKTITVHGPFMDLSPASPDPGIRELSRHRYEQLLEILPAINPVTVVGHPGYDKKRHHFIKDQWLSDSVIFWKDVASGLKAHGCRLMLENVYEERPEDMLYLLQHLIPQHVGFCFDVGHMNVFGITGLHDWLSTLGAYIGQFHLHDNEGDMDMHLAIGDGNIDFQTIFRFLKNNTPILTLEPHEEKVLDRSLEYLAENFSSLF